MVGAGHVKHSAALDWASLMAGLVSFLVLVGLQRWLTAAAVGVICALHLSVLVRRYGP